MSDVVFITPNFGGLVREEPVGTLLLSTILRNAGIHSDILQFHHFGDPGKFEQFLSCAVELISQKAPRIVSFYTRCDTYHISLKIAERIKMHLADVYVVFGGPQADLSAHETLQSIPCVDFVCCGEGERTIVPFFSSLLAGTPDLTVPGLVYRSGDNITANPRPELIPDLDALPMIDYSALEPLAERQTPGVRSLFPVDAGRGCPFACTYCSTKTFWGRNYRLKSPERIVAELKYIHDKFGVTGFNFEHDMFTMNREKVLQTCKLLKNIGFPIRWRCSARMDCLDEDLVDTMTDAGMRVLFTGIESGSARMQRLINKNLKLDDIPRMLAYISSKGVEVTASFIFGFPQETQEDFSQTMALMTQLCKIPRVKLQHHLCTFLPGTELTSQYQEQLLRCPVNTYISGDVAVADCEDVIRTHPNLFPQFYEYQTPLREKTRYYPLFFSCWKLLRPVYEYIAANYYPTRLCDMLFDFTKCNETMLGAGLHYLDVLKQDKFLASFCDDKNYNVLKEVSKFLIWRSQAQVGHTEVFGFDVQAFKRGTDLSALAETISVVSLVDGKNGRPAIAIRSAAQ